MRVLMLNYEFPPIGGGAGKANKCLLAEFAGIQGLEIDMLTSATTPGLTVDQLAENITIYRVGIRKRNLHHWKRSEVISWLYKAYFQYRRMLKNNDYDLAHAFFGFPTGFLPWLTAGKLPYIVSLRGSDVPGQNARFGLEYKILGPLFKSIWKNADALITPSKGLTDRARRFMPDMEYGVIPNGVDRSNFPPGKPRSVSKPVRLITVGRLSSTKKFDMLINAVELLVKRGLDVALTIAGGGALMDSLKKMAADKGLENNVRFVGRIAPERMPGFYADGDMFLSASIQEGMSNAMLEAMAAGLPIIAAKCEGVEELITDNGIVLEEPSAEGFADSVVSLVNDSTGCAAMSKAAAANSANFSWNSAADRYLQLYRSLVNNRGKSQ